MALHIPGTAEIQRVVLVHNHTQEAQRLAAASEDELREKLGIYVEAHMSKPGGRMPNAEYLGGILEEGDIVGAICGDGTFRDLALSIGKTPIISLRGGNARDIGRATHRFRHMSPSWLIRHSQATEAYAMSCAIQQPDGEVRTEHSISYIGTGETAKQSAFLATDEYRKGIKGYRDLRVGIGSLLSDYYFDLVDNDGEERRLSDLTFAKGSRMAKIGRFPVRHWEPYIRVTPIEEGFAAKSVAAAGLLTGHAAGDYYDEPYTFTPLSQTLMHFDGEPPVLVQPQTEVTVSLGEAYSLLVSGH